MPKPGAVRVSTLIPETSEDVRHSWVVCDDHAAFSCRDLFVWIERENGDVAKTPHRSAASGRAQGLASILDDEPTTVTRDRRQVLDSTRPSEHVDGKDCLRPLRGGLLDPRRVHAQGLLFDVDEPRDDTLVQQAVGRGDKAEWRRNDLVAFADLESAHREVQACRSA